MINLEWELRCHIKFIFFQYPFFCLCPNWVLLEQGLLYTTAALHILTYIYTLHRASQVGLVVKNPPAGTAGDLGLIPVLGRYPGGGQGNPLQYSCLENLMDRGAWWATVHGVTKSWIQWKQACTLHHPINIISSPSPSLSHHHHHAIVFILPAHHVKVLRVNLKFPGIRNSVFRLQQQLLPDFLACQPALHILSSKTMWASSLKYIFLYISTDIDPEKAMATYSSILAWEIPWTEEPCGLQSKGSRKSQTQLSEYTTTITKHF